MTTNKADAEVPVNDSKESPSKKRSRKKAGSDEPTDAPVNDASSESSQKIGNAVETEIDPERGDRDETDEAEEADRELATALLEAKEQIQVLTDQLQRKDEQVLRFQAEMQNINKRSQNEIQKTRKYAVEGFAQELLPVKDSLDQAAHVELDQAASEAVSKMQEGLMLTLKQMESALAKFSVTEVEAGPGVKFNPDVHQAVSMIASDEIPSDHIISVMQKGFLLNDRLLRPAMVVVAS